MSKEGIFTLLLGCVLFGEGQGTEVETRVLSIDSVSQFKTEDKLNDEIDRIEGDGCFDSYIVIESYKDLKFDEGVEERMNELIEELK